MEDIKNKLFPIVRCVDKENDIINPSTLNESSLKAYLYNHLFMIHYRLLQVIKIQGYGFRNASLIYTAVAL